MVKDPDYGSSFLFDPSNPGSVITFSKYRNPDMDPGSKYSNWYNLFTVTKLQFYNTFFKSNKSWFVLAHKVPVSSVNRFKKCQHIFFIVPIRSGFRDPTCFFFIFGFDWRLTWRVLCSIPCSTNFCLILSSPSRLSRPVPYQYRTYK
jgi:hypothetical protein